MGIKQASGCVKGHDDKSLGYWKLENESEGYSGTKIRRMPSYKVTSLGG